MLSRPLILPSYKAGFARSAGESAMPELWKELRGIWAPLLGPSGPTLHDGSGRGGDGTLTNMDTATDYVMTPVGWGLNFAAATSTEHVSVPNAANLQLSKLTLWAIVDSGGFNASANGIISKDAGVGADYDMRFANGSGATAYVRFLFYNSGWYILQTDTRLATLGVHSIAATYDGTTATIYYDGIMVKQGDLSFALPTNTNPLYLGSYNASSSLDGSLVAAAVWGDVKPPSAIARLHADPFGLLRQRRFVAKAPAAAAAIAFFPYHVRPHKIDFDSIIGR